MTKYFMKKHFMKKHLRVCLSLMLLFSQQLFAHSDHSHGPISAAEAVALTAKVAKQLSSKDVGLGIGKLPASWAATPQSQIAIHEQGPGYYIVAAENKAEKKTLYVLMSFGGEVYDANFSGVFKGLKAH